MRVRGRTPLPGGGERLDVLSWSTGSPVPSPFDVRLEDGLCLMHARGRLFFVGMAAVPEGPGQTRFRHVEGVPLPGGDLLRPVFRRTSRSDLDRIARELAPGSGGGGRGRTPAPIAGDTSPTTEAAWSWEVVTTTARSAPAPAVPCSLRLPGPPIVALS